MKNYIKLTLTNEIQTETTLMYTVA